MVSDFNFVDEMYISMLSRLQDIWSENFDMENELNG